MRAREAERDAVPRLPAAAPRAGASDPWARIRGWRRPGPRGVALACALIAVTVGILAAVTARGPKGGVSTLVHVASSDAVAPLIRHDDPGFVFVPTAAHYDGTYYYAIARDPIARGRYHDRIDLGAKRYGHPFYGQLAWVLSFGQAYRVAWALLLLSLGALAAGAFCASRIATLLGWSPWAGLVVPLSPGLLYATTVDTSETLGAALIGVGLLAWLTRRRGWATAAFVGLSLTKEPLSLVPVAVLVFEASRVVRRDGWRATARSLRGRWWLAPTAACLAGPVVLLCWLQYVAGRFDRQPLAGNADASTFPLAGLVDTLRKAGDYGLSATSARVQVGAVAIPLVLVLAVAMIVGIVAALRLRTVVDAAFLFTAPLMFILTQANVLYPKDFLRLTVIPFLLLPGVLVRRGPPQPVPATRRPDRRHRGPRRAL